MKIEQHFISRKKAKESFLVANALKEPFKKNEFIGYEDIIKQYNEISKEYSKLNEKELDELINISGPNRVIRYNQLFWEKETINLYKIGGWPEIRGIPPEFTTGTITETYKKIKEYEKNSEQFNLNKKRKSNIEELIKNIKSGKENPLIEIIPIILVPGKMIRGEDYKQWVKENHGNWQEHNTSLFGIDDGNLRSLTLLEKNKIAASCYIGKYFI